MENTVERPHDLNTYFKKTKDFFKFAVLYGTGIVIINGLLYFLGADVFDSLERDEGY